MDTRETKHQLPIHTMDTTELPNNLYGGDDEDAADMAFSKPSGDNKNSKTPIIDNFGENLNKKAADNRISRVIGRDVEIERVVQILSRKTKNNVIILGQSGVGKTSLAEGLALKIENGECNRVLENKVIYSLNISSLVAGTKYRGQLEQRLQGLIKEMRDNPHIILFLDEIHTIIGAGSSSGSLDVANIMKPALTDGSLQVIASTTFEEYRMTIEKDSALERRFQKIILKEPTESETIEMLFQVKNNYEDFHKVKYTDEAIMACVKLTSRYIMDRYQPDKSFDVLDEIGSRAKIRQKPTDKILEIEDKIKGIVNDKINSVKSQKFEIAADLRKKESDMVQELNVEVEKWQQYKNDNRIVIDKAEVETLISEMTGIPVTKVGESEMERLYNLDKELAGKIIGQDNAVEVITNAIRLSRMGLSNPNKPASFMFIGKTGVGKTEMVKQLAQVLFDNKDMMIRLDMSEYSEPYSVSKLIGSANGYIGSDEGSHLINEVRKKPFSIILFDEIEKAHSSVFNTMLQLLDDGKLTDTHGVEGNFRNCIIIMTSNVGVKKSQADSGIGFNKDSLREKNAQNVIEKELKNVFSPEFLNRIDKTVYFNSLTQEDINIIVDKELDELKEVINTINDLGHGVKYTDEYKAYIAKEGYDKDLGVRPLKRVINRYAKEVLSMYILKNNIMVPTNFVFDYVDNEVVVTHTNEKMKKRKK